MHMFVCAINVVAKFFILPSPSAFQPFPEEKTMIPFRTLLLAAVGGGEVPDALGSRNEELLRAYPVDILCAGIGENGHLAFNDPPVADFLDPVKIKLVRLDPVCRQQQALAAGMIEQIGRAHV
mgnify:CR=1 FL=1